MAKDNKVPVFNRLFFKLYLNYAVMLLITAVMICLIFVRLYEKTTMDSKEKELITHAQITATRMAEMNNSKGYDEFYDYIEDQIRFFDIWTISNPNAREPMHSRLETNTYDEIITMDDYVITVEKAFRNIIEAQTGYDEVYEVPTITVAAPIFGLGEEVVGAVVLKSFVEEQKQIISNSLYMMVISCIVALAISFVIIIVFAAGLSLPISRMRVTALELAKGNYRSKTGIRRKDEIGDLAKTVDVLSVKLLENEIERKNLDQMRLDFFANVSHELRTPITVIRAYTETLVDGVVTEQEKIMQYYNRMLHECKGMERLVGDLMLLSKMQNPDFYIEKEPISILEIAEDVVRSAGTIAQKKLIQIHIDHQGEEPLILGDYDRIKQMILIIIDNAIKFSEEYKNIYIKIITADLIELHIQDEGMGIEKGDLANIFEKFYKSNLRQNSSGTGLGLAIAKQISMKHDGTISVESTVSVGTTFHFTFPKFEIDSSIYH